ncbi:hypothetical protein V7024_15730 [Bacillus sp. JJ864]|uniref:hypothetical protein n=1 Tax=Bacillus sp. JJ864 TaxID=3122975 RepID=UPI002FFE17CB
MELAFLRKRKAGVYKQETWLGTFSLLLALITLLYINTTMMMEDVFLGEYVYMMIQVGLVCSVIGMFTREKSRKRAIWAFSLYAFMLVFIFFTFMLAWMLNPMP